MFTPRPIGFVRSPYTNSSQIPKGLGVKHDAEGVLEILREFEPGLGDIDGFCICSFCGSSIARMVLTSRGLRRSTIGRMGCLPRARPGAPTPSVSRL